MTEGRGEDRKFSTGEKASLAFLVALVGLAVVQGCGSEDDGAASSSDTAVAGPSDDGSRTADRDGERAVSSADFTEWPFTVGSGVLACRDGVSVTFTIDGTEYGVNGTAKDAGYPDVDPFWAEDKKLGHGLKVNISEVLNAGRALC